MLSKTSAFAVVASVILAASALGEVQVIPVPYRPHDPSIPHPAYNGRPTTFKAIARGAATGTVYFRWDVDGDGMWDTALGRTLAPGREAGRWYQDSVYNVDFRQCLPTVDPAVTQRKLFLATVQVTESFNAMGEPVDSRFAAYPVMVYADVPQRPDPWPQATAWPDTATDDQLAVMKEAAVDDGLWFLHKQIARSGSGTSTMIGYIPWGSSACQKANNARFIVALADNGRQPAYPPGTYVHNPASYSDVAPLPAGAADENDFRYNNDPYAEDALRLLNYLYASISQLGVDSASEADDGRPPIPGTNNGRGWYAVGNNSEFMEESWCLAAIALASPEFSTVQYGPLTGHSQVYLVQEIVDTASYLQIYSGASLGGWGYWQYSGGDAVFPTGYSTGGWIYGLCLAEMVKGPSGVIVNSRLKGRLATFLAASQHADGGVGTTIAYPSSLETTGFHLLGCRWLGFHIVPADDNQSWAPYSSLTNAQARQVHDKYVNFITNSWAQPTCSRWNYLPHWYPPGYNLDMGSTPGNAVPHSILNTRMAAKLGNPEITEFGTHSSTREFFVNYVKHQYDDGHYQDTNGCTPYSSWIGIAGISAEVIVSLSDPVTGPVAVGYASPMQVLEGCAGAELGEVTFTHAGSYHLDASRRIVDYQWLFDVPDPANPGFDAVNWAAIPDGGFSADGKAWHSTSRDATPVYQYTSAGTYNATLRVVDDDNPPSTDVFVITKIIVTEQEPASPAANAGGPYQISVGHDLVLAGQASDPNCVCGDTLTVTWDLNSDGLADVNGAAATVPWPTLLALNLPIDLAFNTEMVVTDSTGLVAKSTTQLTLLPRTLVVRSFPKTDIPIAGSHSGTTDYEVSCEDQDPVNLTAPSTITVNGITWYFEYWLVDNAARPAGQDNLQLTMAGAHTAIAVYNPRIAGDLNSDCRVNVLDLIQVRNKLGSKCSQ